MDTLSLSYVGKNEVLNPSKGLHPLLKEFQKDLQFKV